MQAHKTIFTECSIPSADIFEFFIARFEKLWIKMTSSMLGVISSPLIFLKANRYGLIILLEFLKALGP